MNKYKTDYDIAIIGAGLVGSIQALLLAKYGFKVVLIDLFSKPESKYLRNSQDSQGSQGSQDFEHVISSQELPPDLRMSAITLRSEEILTSIDIWQLVKNRSGLMQKTHVWEENSPGEVTFDSLSIGKNYLSTIVENNLILELANNKISEHENIRIIRPCKILELNHNKSGYIEILIDQINNANSDYNFETISLSFTNPLKVNLVIGADGANSWVRNYVNFECEIRNYEHSALIANVYTEKPHDNIAYQHFLSDGPLAFLPWHDPHCCSIVWSQSHMQAQYWLQAQEQDFNQQLEQNFNSILGKITRSSKRFVLPLTMRHVKQYYKSGVVLIGDAAHTIHPLAGQGLNLGIYDAHELAMVLSNARQKNQQLSHDKILAKYQSKRRGHNQEMINFMQLFKDAYKAKSKPSSFARALGMNILNNSTILKQQVMRYAAGLY